MKTNLNNSFWYAKIKYLIISVFMVALFVNTYATQSKVVVELDKNDLSNYQVVINQTLKNSEILLSNTSSNIYSNLQNNAKKSLDVNAKGALESGLATYWYPHFLATSVIVYDKSVIREEILSWSDLMTVSHPVGFLNSQENLQSHLSAMSYGLEGENYSLNKAVTILANLKDKDLLNLESKDSIITICYDYEAVKLKELNKNLMIVIPSEGSLTFEVGLLSSQRLDFESNLDMVLIDNNLRPIKSSKPLINYPSEVEYNRTSKVNDFNHYSKNALKATRIFSRQVLNEQPFTSVDKHEHMMVALVYLMIVTFWTASAIYRATQKPIIFAAIFTGIILSSWTLVRIIRYQILVLDTLSRYLWYSYYIFQIFIPLIILWMAWSMDRPNTYIKLPKWWYGLISFAIFLIALVFTNDYHGLVLVLDMTRLDWTTVYSYGIGYYIILIFAFSLLLSAFLTLVIKGLKTPNRNVFSIPLFLFILFAIYNYMYIVRVPIIYQTDITIVTGVFTMLMFESNIRFGLIPTNTRYIDLFKLSPLKIQIFDKDKNLVLASLGSKVPQADYLNKLLRPASTTILDNNNLIFAKSIPGGYALWFEDISAITTLYKNILTNNQLLEEANIMLAKKKNMQAKINEELLKQEILKKFESKLIDSFDKVSDVVNEIEAGIIETENIVRLPLLLTYIKRRSNLFFEEKKNKNFKIEVLDEYILELAKITAMAKLEVALYNEINENILSSQASLFYDFFYNVLQASLNNNNKYLITYISKSTDKITMQLLPSKELKEEVVDEKFKKAISKEGGITSQKNIEDTVGYTLSFPKGRDHL